MNSKKPLIVALYLPQYYETEYNNEWWGKGYTEWTACKKARPLFKNHNQPKIPLNKNYYDLSQKHYISWQMETAKKHGVDGFAIYQYYSCEKKLLEVPTEIIRDNKDLDLPFYLFWANESWRKMWFGQDKKIVWEQKYGTKADWIKHFEYCLTFFVDDRYIKIDGKPVYAIYNAWDIPNIDDFISVWNTEAKKNGFTGIYFIKALGRHDTRSLDGFSAVVTREPNASFAFNENLIEKVVRVTRSITVEYLNTKILIPIRKGIVNTRISYDKMWRKVLSSNCDSTTCLGAFVNWDNSPRRGFNSIIITGATPTKFYKYMKELHKKAIKCGSPMILINAWNEWAEGAYLEPDEQNGFEYLYALHKALQE